MEQTKRKNADLRQEIEGMQAQLPQLKLQSDAVMQKFFSDRVNKVNKVWQWEEYTNSYKSVFEMVNETYRTYKTMKQQDILKSLTYGRAGQEDGAKYEERFYSKFTDNKTEWRIISDYASLFTGLPLKREFSLDERFPFNLDLELAYKVFWQLGLDEEITSKLI